MTTDDHANAYRVANDVSYGPYDRNVLDVYSREDITSAPLVVGFHGGGWKEGSKDRDEQVAPFFLERGWAFAAANYRLTSDGFSHPAQVVDGARAVDHLRANDSAYDADGSTVVLQGVSAGAHVAAMVAYHDERDWADGESHPGLQIAGFVGIAGVYDFHRLDPEAHAEALRPLLGSRYDTRDWDDAAPVAHVSPGDPPALLVHGAEDDFVPPRVSERFAEELHRHGVAADLYLAPGRDHGDRFPHPLGTEEIERRIGSFLSRVTG